MKPHKRWHTGKKKKDQDTVCVKMKNKLYIILKINLDNSELHGW
jgi:hypothetical protein